MSDEIRPFRIEIPQADLDDLRDRLAAPAGPTSVPERWPDWSRGIPWATWRELAEYWRTGVRLAGPGGALNALPQFTTEIDGQRIHFLHVRSEPSRTRCRCCCTHGFPSSVAEFLRLIGPLRRARRTGRPST